MTYRQQLILLLVLLFFPSQAFAYIDPGTGSMVLQLLLAGIAGLGVVLKLFWHRIVGMFGKKKDPNTDEERDADSNDQ